jgi:hypothetical protein
MTQNMILSTVQDLAINAVAQGIVQATGIPQALQGTNDMVNALVMGHGFAIVNDAVMWFYNGESKILNADWLALEDEALYNSLVNYGFMVADIDLMIAQAVAQNSPLGPQYNRAIAMGTIGVITNTMRDWVERNAGSNVFLNRLVKPTGLLF